ncbi:MULTISPECIES: 5-methyltetrahydropteroyltriglutamate--homocysteine S-methyltransferase [unclassified Mucilaginibacter]|uniref:5-methyltetrahydropteroyltriglutamate-- homocysteine S-methyltransferase n=1 Tax=unclassified Mucilaginibacter TaxID=2617802 RepID=UPI002AC981A8|nr:MULTISPECIES: 5-methyltetrahydropteroyltriglutamate--homocysteine S-methyltransferase [unclassified Mucilaginibacter]MEB0263707.1 5-methyltetrahydropteroyltriglutamate--homocysteine S-methyltransferase [Mucilaginibacter sp. 10I4]MEB0278771.1 5-methyltetrahydropteroyltriglutamate--homocysteine S-methyltransferase [Mucilaginibacter sp. 10B2]MEB0299864.1 5-methyltetrahydropteroyltriglutamate--homocysteine S-methyltransferase [Mucilaginibacter sp. 5C4]WPX21955.1 5-methyltetrahydropteroyltrigluta
MLTQNLGYPRIGGQRELKKVCEGYWAGKTGHKNVLTVGKTIRHENWLMQKEAGIDLIPSNDFSYYDHVLDHSLMFGAIPKRYNEVILKQGKEELDLYFAMARGYQKDELDVVAMEMTKWFDTNYHYIVPEFYKNQQFRLFSTKITNEFYEAKQLGIITKPVLIGPVTYLLLGKEKEAGFEKIDLLKNLLPVYTEILTKLLDLGAEWIQFDEPFLSLDLTEKEQQAYRDAYKQLRKDFPRLKFVLATYFEKLGSNAELAASLPVDALHIDLVRAPQQLDEVLELLPAKTILSLGVVDGRNIWKNNFEASLAIIQKAKEKLGDDRVWIAPSCSLIHSPVDLRNEHNPEKLTPEIKQWLAFARQKVTEIALLKSLASDTPGVSTQYKLVENQHDNALRKTSGLIHNNSVKERVAKITESDAQRLSAFASRKQKQQELLNLPLYTTTTIGSFPQTAEVRSWRAQLKKGAITQTQYDLHIAEETEKAVKWQEDIDIDVLVHGEFERNDMVEYFGEQLQGFTFTQNGWVQSYGSRCVKPPIIYGDVSRPRPMTVKWSGYAQSLTNKWMKGMLTGPVTILQWSFVRNDQPRSATCTQIALAIRDEVCDLEMAGIKIIQIDEPAIREGLPLRIADWAAYLDWAVKAFRISASGVQDDTQIHTHMCYSEFNDIIQNIADMDADVITIETSRSQMELLDVFADFKYPNEIGPGVYDIHSPRVPNRDEMTHLLKKARAVIPDAQLWVNPDCGLKTRGWDETKKALIEMVAAAKEMRATVAEPVTI